MRLFIGYDSREALSYSVLSHSIIRRSSIPISIQPVILSQLNGLYTRARGPLESTEFSFSRFLVPYLSDYDGWSVFMDCDMLCLTDIAELDRFIETQKDKSVIVCKHNYTPKSEVKFLGQQQAVYPRKNWSSFMLLNNTKCRKLTPNYVNKASGFELHRFHWLEDSEIGDLPLDWNYLVDESNQSLDQPKMVHFTNGGPWFKAYQTVEYANHWHEELANMRSSNH